jgi:hypothetical protein
MDTFTSPVYDFVIDEKPILFLHRQTRRRRDMLRAMSVFSDASTDFDGEKISAVSRPPPPRIHGRVTAEGSRLRKCALHYHHGEFIPFRLPPNP